MVHAGIPPIWTLNQARFYAHEVEQELRHGDYRNFLTHMYGNQPTGWQPGLQGMERLRVITNYLTRMRFCDRIGQLDLVAKQGIAFAPPGMQPWFQYKQRLTAEQRIIFGHWAALEGKFDDGKIFGLDTGCIWGNQLTLMRLDNQQCFQCDCQPPSGL